MSSADHDFKLHIYNRDIPSRQIIFLINLTQVYWTNFHMVSTKNKRLIIKIISFPLIFARETPRYLTILSGVDSLDNEEVC